jgi:hypothetical protein
VEAVFSSAYMFLKLARSSLRTWRWGKLNLHKKCVYLMVGMVLAAGIVDFYLAVDCCSASYEILREAKVSY